MEHADLLKDRVVLSLLKDLKKSIEELNSRIENLEKKFEVFPKSSNETIYPQIKDLKEKILKLEEKIDERIPEKVLSESLFKKEAQDGEEFIEVLISRLKQTLKEQPERELTIVEKKRIEEIESLLKKHKKLSSWELSELTGLSRTRCNEYFKLMENLGMVESILNGKKKFYKLKDKLFT